MSRNNTVIRKMIVDGGIIDQNYQAEKEEVSFSFKNTTEEIEVHELSRPDRIKRACEILKREKVSLSKATGIQMRLKYYDINNDEAKDLFEAMKGLPITMLSIDCKNMGVDSIAALGEVINPAMRFLDLSRSSFDSQGSKKLGDTLALGPNNISYLGIMETNFDVSGSEGLANFIRGSKCLSNLNLKNSKIGDGVKNLWPAISETYTLTEIDISGSDVTGESLTGMSEALSKQKNFDRITLHSNEKVGNSGCEEIGSAINNNQSKFNSCPNLSNLGIGDSGLKILANSFRPDMSTLHLNGNSEISTEGLTAANKIFKKNAFLTRVELEGTGINPDDSCRKDLDDIIARNSAIDDAVSDYAKSVLAPRLIIADCNNKGGRKAILNKIIYDLEDITKNVLFADLNSEQIIEFSEHWHQPLQQVKSNRVKDFGMKEWDSLFGSDKKEIEITLPEMEGWKLVTRNNSHELKKEGEDLGHCVGGYTSKCLTGNSHIVSVVNAEGVSVSTIEIETDYLNNSFKQEQHFGKKNTPITKESKMAEKWLYEEIKQKKICIDYRGLESSRTKRDEELDKNGEREKMIIGFNPLDRKKVKNVRKIFKDMLPDNNQQIKDNFSLLTSHPEIGINGEIYGLAVPEQPNKDTLSQGKKDAELNIERTFILNKMQGTIDSNFGENFAIVDIIFPSKDTKNKFGDVTFKTKGNPDSLIDLFNKDKIEQTDDVIRVIGMKPKSVMGILEKIKVVEEKPSSSTSQGIGENLKQEVTEVTPNLP